MGGPGTSLSEGNSKHILSFHSRWHIDPQECMRVQYFHQSTMINRWDPYYATAYSYQCASVLPLNTLS